jgi:lauroyl/myristoyl acyltransferase
MAEPARTLRRARRRLVFLASRTLVRLAGFEGTRRLGAVLGALQYRLGSADRRRCLHDLALLQNRSPGDPLVARQLREAYRVNTVAVLQVLAMFDRRVDSAVLESQCRIDGLAELEAARAGKGAILLATHSGNSLLLIARLASEGWPVTLLYRQARMMSADFFAAGLPRYGIEGILANEGLKAYAKMIAALRRNRVVFAIVDQGVKFEKDGVPMRFLGKDMPMPGGVAQLARASGAPVLPVVTLAAEPRWHFAIEPPLFLDPGATLEEDVETLLRVTERQVLERPQLWSWHHRRWRKFPLAAAPKRARQ